MQQQQLLLLIIIMILLLLLIIITLIMIILVMIVVVMIMMIKVPEIYCQPSMLQAAFGYLDSGDTGFIDSGGKQNKNKRRKQQ